MVGIFRAIMGNVNCKIYTTGLMSTQRSLLWLRLLISSYNLISAEYDNGVYANDHVGHTGEFDDDREYDDGDGDEPKQHGVQHGLAIGQCSSYDYGSFNYCRCYGNDQRRGNVNDIVSKLTTQLPLPTGPSSGLVFLSLILFVVAVAVIGKIIYSNRKRRSDLIGGTARWRLAASQQSGAGPQQTAASYAPMGGSRQASATNGLDTPGPDRLDWERQFFDDTEATVRD
ncbi:unnamed protein product [Heligmosomoides polygyrus]|uniref:Gram_pos_anchor domain-containing protein n=1 Tax=Heligmosomoides polygyrus TaxID=6339 RepID=A0A3P8E3D3_HELPZ|nr:unnamed protein product [Heligmosomoides polygyrus]